jgi:transposase
MEFMREFPDDNACLEWLWRTRHSPDGERAHCPKCDQDRAFKRYATMQRRQSWTCTACGHHVHPTARSIFVFALVVTDALGAKRAMRYNLTVIRH